MRHRVHSVCLAEFGPHSPFHRFWSRLHKVQAAVGAAPVEPWREPQTMILSEGDSITHHAERGAADVVPRVGTSRVSLGQGLLLLSASVGG
jgi:hypothetical protein